MGYCCYTFCPYTNRSADVDFHSGRMTIQKLVESLSRSKIAHCAERLAELARPTIFVKIQEEGSPVKTFSAFGGDPEMPPDLEWPSDDSGQVLSFLAQFEMSEIHAFDQQNLMPLDGRLWFFYECNEQPWGFDPKHKSGWRVIYHQTANDCVVRIPPRRNTESLVKQGFMESLKSLARVNREPPGPMRLSCNRIKFEYSVSMPFYDSASIDALGLTKEEVDHYTDWWLNYTDDDVIAQILGYPRPIQNVDMETDCQLVSNGIYIGDLAGRQSPQARELLAHPNDWLLLLQIDSSEKLDIMWGDAGTLYFWIREKDLRKAEFGNVWTILQCF